MFRLQLFSYTNKWEREKFTFFFILKIYFKKNLEGKNSSIWKKVLKNMHVQCMHGQHWFLSKWRRLVTNVSPAIVCWQLDLWYVILNGAVEISHQEGRVEVLCMGNSFGISPSLDKQYMNGEVRTKGDDCQVKSQHNSSKCSGVGL